MFLDRVMSDESTALVVRPESTTSLSLYQYFQNKPKCLQSCESPRDVILPFVVESAVSVGYASALLPFLSQDTKWWVHPYANAIYMLAFSLMLKFPKSNNDFCKNFVLPMFRAIPFAILDSCTRYILWHESGHYAAARAIAENARPNITIHSAFLNSRGVTLWNVPNSTIDYTSFGESLGFDHSMLLFLEAGALMTQVWNFVSLITAQLIPADYLNLKAFIRATVAFSMYRIFEETFKSCTYSSTDYCEIEKRGVSSVLFSSLLIGSMLLLQIILSCTQYHCCKKNVNEDDNNNDVLPTVEEIRGEEEDDPENESELSNIKSDENDNKGSDDMAYDQYTKMRRKLR